MWAWWAPEPDGLGWSPRFCQKGAQGRWGECSPCCAAWSRSLELSGPPLWEGTGRSEPPHGSFCVLLKEGAKGSRREWGRAKSEGSSVQPWRGRRPRDTRAPGERKRGAGRADRQAVSTLAAASPAGELRLSESRAEAGLSPLVDCRPHFSQLPPQLLGSQDGVLSLAWGSDAQLCLLSLAPRDAIEGF